MSKETIYDSTPVHTYKRRYPKKKMDIPEEYRPPAELGCELVTFQLTNKVTTRSSKFVSPFKAPILYRQPPNVEKAMKLRDIILASPPSKELRT